MTAPESTVRFLPAQPPEPNPTRIHKGDAALSLQEMLGTAFPLPAP
jgi:hypothetical protein